MERNHQSLGRYFIISLTSLPRSVNLWKEDEDKPRKNARWKWHWRRGETRRLKDKPRNKKLFLKKKRNYKKKT